jgi:hypothetical protein
MILAQSMNGGGGVNVRTENAADIGFKRELTGRGSDSCRRLFGDFYDETGQYCVRFFVLHN